MSNFGRTMIPLAAAAVAVLGAGPALAQAVGMGTGKQGFYTYSAGAAISKVASDNGLAMRIQPFGGTSAYVPAVNAKEVDFGLANELETTYAVTGKVIYKGKQQPDVRVVTILTPFISALWVAKGSPIKSATDLKGKRVPAGYASQRVLEILTKGTLANVGLTLADVKQVPVPNVVRGANDFASGKADTFMFAMGAGKVRETNAKIPLRPLPIDPSPAAMKRLREFVPVGYALKVNPGPAALGVSEPTYLMAYDYLVIASSKVPADTVYKLAKIMHGHSKALTAAFKPLRGFDPKRMAKDMGAVKFHDGTVKFLKEINAWPPKG
jgi:TRAP transporter TAXI family solute receptor